MQDSSSPNSVSGIRKPLGEILVEAGLISISQIEIALQEQQQSGLLIGEILASHDWIKQKTVDFFAEQWQKIVRQEQKKPLPYYFKKAALLDERQIKVILKLQKLKHEKVRFHRLAIEQGYIKQTTVDFFLAHLFNVYDPNSISVAKPYEVLRDYVQGKKDFSGVDLSKAPLMSVSLKGVLLNGSNLRKADLSMANLSNSSLIRVNLSLANLTKAILTQVDFSRAFLTRANLQAAHLEKTNFHKAILHEVDFQSAYLAQANFSGADLSKAKLPLNFPYEVYYDKYTIFDCDFNPKLAGWKKK